MRLLLLPALLSAPIYAISFPFTIPFFSGQTPLSPIISSSEDAQNVGNRVAIIGAGAGGSSAAFWIAKARERFPDLDVEVDVFERNGYIGGRSTVVYPYDDPELAAVELGASIFVGANKHLWRASDEFGLSRTDFADDDNEMGIWDGQEFVLTAGGSFLSSWWDTLKVLWRYGFSGPRKTQSLVKSMMDKYLALYSAESPRWDNLTALTAELGWTDVVAQSTAEYFDLQGVDLRWTREVVDAATRVNYGQNVNAIHALEGMCSLAGTSASSVIGGNFQIFEQFLNRSGAAMHLNTTVTALHPTHAGWSLTYTGSDASRVSFMKQYKAVILAAPYHFAALALPESVAELVPEQPYVHLHVTLLATPAAHPNSTYFGLPKNVKAPREILTTSARGGEAAGIEFNSLTYHGKVNSAGGGAHSEEWVVKIFSKQRVSDEWLEGMFGTVGWVYRKEWDAYPYVRPTVSFPPVKLADRLYYVNAFEPLISTMETETISARNIVDLMLREEFKASICPPTLGSSSPLAAGKEDFVLGFDC